jgi:hypothetical protein
MSSGDDKEYYADLGVSPSASADEIRSVYRALAKIYHPDVNRDRAAAEKFRRVTQAYEVLCDPEKRRIYDAGDRAPPDNRAQAGGSSSKQQTMAPIRCSVCSKITAQPRFLIFSQVTSIILVTTRTPKAGIFCSHCASKIAFRATAMSAAFGWWGIPWGPIHTVGAILKNALGGERREALDEELWLHNAVAFSRMGNLGLARALASRLQSSANSEIADLAKKLHQQLSAQGAEPATLKSPWTFKAGATFGQIFVGAIVPTIAVLIGVGATYQGQALYYPTPPAAFANQDLPSSDNILNGGTTAASPENVLSKLDSGASRTAVEPPADLCPLRPENESVLGGKLPATEYGHRLAIQNGSTGDAIIKVRDVATNRLVVSFFAARNQTAAINNLPDGNYRIQYAYGDAMTADCNNFQNPAASEFGVERLATTTTDTQIITQDLSYTLYAVVGGNVTPTDISPDAFNAD